MPSLPAGAKWGRKRGLDKNAAVRQDTIYACVWGGILRARGRGRLAGKKDFVCMGKKLYVGNLSYNTTEGSLQSYFSQFGTVAQVKVIFDRESGNSKGFGFVEMATDEDANAAIAGANGQEFEGRQLRVNVAIDKPRRDRSQDGRW